MYSYMYLAAAVRNAPSQCQQLPGICSVDATPVRPHIRESNIQQRSPQIHPAPIGRSQCQKHQMGIHHRHGVVHTAERCRSRVDGTVQHQPLNRYQQPTTEMELRFCLPAAIHIHLIEMAKRIFTSALQSRARGPVGTPPPRLTGVFLWSGHLPALRSGCYRLELEMLKRTWPWTMLQALRKDAENQSAAPQM